MRTLWALSLVLGLALFLAPAVSLGDTLWWDIPDDSRIRHYGVGPLGACMTGQGQCQYSPACYGTSCAPGQIELSDTFMEKFTAQQEFSWNIAPQVISGVKAHDPLHVAAAYYLYEIVPNREDLDESYYAHDPTPSGSCSSIRKQSVFAGSLEGGVSLGSASVGDITNADYRSWVIYHPGDSLHPAGILPRFELGPYDAQGLDMYSNAFWWLPGGNSCTADRPTQVAAAGEYLREISQAIGKPVGTNQIPSDTVFRKLIFGENWPEVTELAKYTRFQMTDLYMVYPKPDIHGNFTATSGQGFERDDTWVNMQNYWITIGNLNNYFGLVSDINAPMGSPEESQGLLYALSSFLLIKNPLSSYGSALIQVLSSLKTWVCQGADCPTEPIVITTLIGPEYLLDLGSPVSSARSDISELAVTSSTCFHCSTKKAVQVTGDEGFRVYAREFEKGYVFVNPTSQSSAHLIVPPGSAVRNRVHMRGASFLTASGNRWFFPPDQSTDGGSNQPHLWTDRVSDLKLPPASAIILLNAPVDRWGY